MNEKWIAEGWRAFRTEVLKKDWPELPELDTVLEISFYSGAMWVMAIIGEEGGSEATAVRIMDELREHLKEKQAIVDRFQK